MTRFISTRILMLTGMGILSAWGPLSAAPINQANANQQNRPAQQQMSQNKNQQQAPQGFSREEILKLSEAFGHFIGRNLNNPGIQFDLESIIRGMRNGVAGNPAPMTDQEYEKMMAKLQESAFQQLSQENIKAANAFMEKNRSAAGIVELEPGKLQFLILQEGNGPVVKSDSVPQVNYVGKYLDGTTFGSSQEVGGPITVPLNQTIKGFSKGLVGMKEGEKRRLFVHPDLGYGVSGQLPPNALLIFEVELVKADTPNHKQQALSKALGDKASNSVPGEDDDDMDDEDDLDDLDDDADDDEEEIPPPKTTPAPKSNPAANNGGKTPSSSVKSRY